MSSISSQDIRITDREVVPEVQTAPSAIDQLIQTNEKIARRASQDATAAHINLNEFEMGWERKPSTSLNAKFLVGVTKQIVGESLNARHDADSARIKYFLLRDIHDIFSRYQTAQIESGQPIDIEALQKEIIMRIDRRFNNG